MKRLLEISIKVLTPKEKAKKSRELNLKRKLEEVEVDRENEENVEGEEVEEGGEREEDGDKESMLPVNRSNSRRKGIPRRAPFF